jgi:hypothetical protein
MNHFSFSPRVCISDPQRAILQIQLFFVFLFYFQTKVVRTESCFLLLNVPLAYLISLITSSLFLQVIVADINRE